MFNGCHGHPKMKVLGCVISHLLQGQVHPTYIGEAYLRASELNILKSLTRDPLALNEMPVKEENENGSDCY